MSDANTRIEVLDPGAGPDDDNALLLSIERFPEPALVFSADGVILSGNAAAMALFDADRREQVIGKPIVSFRTVSEEDSRGIWRDLLSGKILRFEIEFKSLKGNQRRLEIVDIPLLSASGKVERIVGMARDVTEQRRTERRRDSLAAIIESSDDAIMSVSPDLRLIQWNPGAEKMYGFTAQEAIGQSFTLMVPAELHSRAFAQFDAMRADRSYIERIEVPGRRKDGSLIDVSIVGFSVYSRSGELLGFSSIHRDISERLRVERERALLAAAVENSEDALTTISMDGRITSLNPSAQKLFGLSAHEAIGQPFEITVPQNYREIAKRQLEQDLALMREQHTVRRRLEVSIPKKDGTVAEVLLLVSGIYDHRGDPLGMSQTYHDITERKRAEREQARLAAIVESSGDAIVSLNPDGNIATWNRGAQQLFGFSRAEAIGKPTTIFIPGEQHERSAEVIRRLQADPGLVLNFEAPNLRKDGSIIETSMTVFGTFDAEGNLLGVSSIHRDVTERRRAEREQALLAALVKSSDDAICSVSTDFKILSWNRGAEKLFGFSAEEAVGQKIVDLYVPPEMRQPAEQMMREDLAALLRDHDFVRHLETTAIKSDGSLMEISITASGIYDNNGVLLGMSNIVRDVTQRNRSERRLATMASIVNACEDVIIAIDSHSRIIEWNPAAERTYGYKAEQVLGQGPDKFVGPEELQRDMEIARRVLTTGERASFEHHRPVVDGERPISLVDLFPIRDSSGNIVAAGAIARDVTDLKQIEKELRSAQEYTRGLIESSIDAMVVVDRELRITDGNEQLARLTEVPKRDLFGSRFDAYFKDPGLANAAIERALADGFVANCDLVLCAASGKEIMVSFNASLFYREGQVFGIFGVARNVTDQRATERRLEEERQYSRSLIECSADALLISDPGLVVTDLNQRAVEFSGYARTELIGEPLAVLFTDPKWAAEEMRGALEKGGMREVELCFLTREARQVPVAMNASVYRDTKGVARGLLVELRDISEHKRYETGRALLAAIVESSSDAIYSEAPDLTITSWNAAAEKLFGYSASEIVGRNATLLVPIDRREELLEHRQAVERNAGSEHYETRRLRKDGTLVEIDMIISPILDQAGKLTGISLTAHDIGERKRMREELTTARDAALEAARIKSEFLANMSHEIRTPLNSIIGMTGLLLEEQLTAEQREYAHDVRESGETLLKLINDILDFSKVTAGKVVFEEVDFELTGAVEGAVGLVADAARRKQLQLTTSIDPDCPQYLRGDPGRLRQVLLNLLNNGVKFTSQGEVSVRVSKLSENPREAVLRFEVTDSGIGIPQEKQHLLFQPFTQVDASTTRHFGGTGLGLSIARELVGRMGGTIAVSSTPGHGSTFWFTVKFAKQMESGQRAAERFALLAGAKVLIVDDNAGSREILTRTLTRWGMKAQAVSSAQAALDLLRQQPAGAQFRVALVAATMPEIDGFELAGRISAEPALGGPPIIFVSSGGSLAEFASSVRGLSVGGWLMKPVSESTLYRALAKVLAPEREEQTPPEPQEHPLQALELSAHRKLTALIAEDNPVNQKLAKLQLAKLGFEVDAVNNGREAIEALSHTPYDVILMDCQMPEMDGYEATREIRRQEGTARHSKIVAMTAHALQGDRDKCIAVGMDAYLSKPVALGVLEKVLAEVLASGPTGSNSETAAGN
jgi:two-component system sensor histidine kinase/response regulator